MDRIENALGQFLQFTRTEKGTLTDISATVGVSVHLHYDVLTTLLSSVKRIFDNDSVVTLVQY
ncbi:hypothetical protein, partial [Pseudomonas syringae group genomosp. 7]|uniref:hypothetical protein n=1 Tax=Pseudomonas syringae group genomosp. 7 TaxID=251699 RepID=UPI003770365D